MTDDSDCDDTEPVARTALATELADELRRRVLHEPGFMRLTQVSRYGGRTRRISLRPVMLKGERCHQVERVEQGRTLVHNVTNDETGTELDRLFAQKGPREVHLVTAAGDLHVRVTRKGRALVSRSRPLAREVEEAPSHDHAKHQPLQAFDSGALLRVTGIADADGRIKASMRGKYDQVNEFLRLLDSAVQDLPAGTALSAADCGCGRAYLTFAAYAYLTQARGLAMKVRGIERNPERVEQARRMASDLDVAEDVQFLAADLATCQLEDRPDIVFSLHACDTATDEALARGVEWGSRVMLCAPCCQHELQQNMTGGGAMRAVLRHGILRERLADILTDTFRAQILRICGYRVSIVEFVSAEATARNLLLRAEYGVKPGQPRAVSEYLELRDLWQVSPFLATRLGERLSRHMNP